ncbi:TolC family protein [Roseateles sp.]|uniref:TolC family protein n=1 Tax=Roseateles sp. TaxID=1971397 RepID=UPI0032639845
MITLALRSAALAAALLPTLAGAAALSLEQALDLAVQRSATMQAAQAGTLSATEAARVAGRLPDPVLSAGIDNVPATGRDRFTTTADFMTAKRVGLSQEWLSADKRAAQRAAAQAAVDREAAAAHIAAAETRLQTALAYVDAFYATETLQLTDLAEHYGQEEFETARAKLAAATGTGQEALAMSSARGVAEDAAAEARQAQRQAQIQLSRWTGEAVEGLAAPAFAAPPDEPAFVASHPAVVAAQRDVELARQEASVTQANRQPNWTWSLSYGQRTGYGDMVSAGVSIPIPIAPARRQDRETASKLALVDKAQANLAEAERVAATEYRSLATDAERWAQRLQRYRAAVLEPARQRIAVATAGYGSNQAPLVALFEARDAELAAQRKLLSLQRELARARAQLAFKPVPEGAAR